jgi:hypothetical protein
MGSPRPAPSSNGTDHRTPHKASARRAADSQPLGDLVGAIRHRPGLLTDPGHTALVLPARVPASPAVRLARREILAAARRTFYLADAARAYAARTRPIGAVAATHPAVRLARGEVLAAARGTFYLAHAARAYAARARPVGTVAATHPAVRLARREILAAARRTICLAHAARAHAARTRPIGTAAATHPAVRLARREVLAAARPALD